MRELTAVLLCGGKGERLLPLTKRLPKPLVPLKGRPILAHIMHYLAASGLRRFVVCVGYRARTIQKAIGGFADRSWEVACVDSGDVSMTDRLLDVRPWVPGRALICYGDTLANVDVATLVHHHERCGGEVTMTVYPLHSPFGIVQFDPAHRVSSFAEKPVLPHWINIGFMLWEAAAFDRLRQGSDMPDFLASVAGAGRLFAYPHRGKHLTVNTEGDRVQAERHVVEFLTLLERQEI